MELVAIGSACGAMAALPGLVLLDRALKRNEASMVKAFASLGFSFAFLTVALAVVHRQAREYVLTFGVSAIGVFLVLWILAAIRALRASN